MNKTIFSKQCLSAILCVVLIAVTALSITGCTQSKGDDTVTTTTTVTTTAAADTVTTTTAADTTPTRLGLGQTAFTFEAEDKEGNKTVFEILTDEETVGAALINLNLIAGEDSQYGLYVHTVNGTTVDYDKDGKYWAFYIDGEYAMTSVDLTDIAAGSTYTFKVE